jgi:hypothetical protein
MPSFLIVDSSVCRGTPSLTAAPVASLRESEGVVGGQSTRISVLKDCCEAHPHPELARSSPARCGLGRGTPVVCPCHSDYAMHVSTGMISWKYGLSEASHTKSARLPSGAITNAFPDFGAKNVRGAAGSKQTPQIPASDGELMAITPLQRTTP